MNPSAYPTPAAAISAVERSLVVRPGSAPYRRSSFMISISPHRAARMKRRCARFVKPGRALAVANFRVRFRTDVGIGALFKKLVDERRCLSHIRHRDRSRFDIAMLHRQIERRPALCISKVRICAIVQQELGNGIMPVLNRDQHCTASIARGLVRICAPRR